MTENSSPNRISGQFVRPILESDLDSIVNLHNLWALVPDRKASCRGFLLAKTRRDFLYDRLFNEHWQGLVLEERGALLGYILASRDIPESDNLDWLVDHNDFTGDPEHLHIREIAVAPDALRLGVGRILYGILGRRADCSSLSAFVATQPLKNTPSIDFHRAQSFSPGALFKKDEFMGLKDYGSTLYVRKLQRTENTRY